MYTPLLKRPILLIIIILSTANFLFSQDCINLETFEDDPLNELTQAPQPFPGIFAAYGEPLIVEENCTPAGFQGVRLRLGDEQTGDIGDAIVYNQGGANPDLDFKAGVQYEYSFVKRRSTFNQSDFSDFENPTLTVALTNDLECGGSNCEIITPGAQPKSIAEIGDGNCHSWDAMTFTPSQDYKYMIIFGNSSIQNPNAQLYVVLDDICIKESINECIVDFELEIAECGKVTLTSTSQGATNLIYTITGGGFPPVTVSGGDQCFPFTNGTYTINLKGDCPDGTIRNAEPQQFTITENSAPIFGFCPSVEILTGTGIPGECSADYTLPDLMEFDADGGILTVDCTLDNVPFTGSTVTITEGAHVIRCTVTDECGNTGQCDYDLIVECEMVSDSTECTDFNDGNIGAWRRYNSLNGVQSVDNNPAATAGGPSGLPGDNYLRTRDRGGSTWLINESDYATDWNQYIGQCICYDYNLIDDATNGTATVTPQIFLFSNFDNTQPIAWGTNPVLAARWRANTTITETSGWSNLCPDVALCDATGNLPSNPQGTWSWVNGAGSTCTDWNSILGQVDVVAFSVDLTPTVGEILGVDNICFGPCPPEPDPCMYDLTVDTISTMDGECCYELDLDAQDSWRYVNFNLQTPGVIFNTAMVDTNIFRVDTLSNGTQIRVAGKAPSWGGIPAGNYPDFMKFCFANVDSAAQSPQCVVAEYFNTGPNDGPQLACRDTLKFNCQPVTEVIDTCLALVLDAECDPEDPNRYKLTFDATNQSNFTASQVTLTSQDPNVNFLPIGAPVGAIPQPSISVPIAGGLSPNNTVSGLMVTLVTTTAISTPTQWCVSGHLYSQSMCCTAPDLFCTELDVCCDPCERNDIFVDNISGNSATQTLTFAASDDGHICTFQVGHSADTNGPTLETTSYDPTILSDGAICGSYMNFDFLEEICEGAIIAKAELILFADPSSFGHTAQFIDDNCFTLTRVNSPWDESTLSTTIPTNDLTNVLAVNDPRFMFENYTIDVKTLVDDMLLNPTSSYGFELTPCNRFSSLYFASKEHPNSSLHPQLVITFDDQECENPTLIGECCHSVDLINECETDFFTKVEIKSITPGVIIGSHATGGSTPQDWQVTNSTPNCITWEHNSGFIPSGTSNDVIEFCLDDIDPTEVPQEVVLNWYALDGNGEPYIACSDTMTFDCEPIDNPCIAVIDTELKGSPCDSLDCFETPFCLQWLRDTITVAGTHPEIISYNTVEKGMWSGQPVFIMTNPTPPGAANIGNTDIFLCDGSLIQSCAITIGGEVCSPDAGIDPFTDITSKTMIWQTGDPLPPIDPDCASGTGGQNIVDVCMTFKNSSTHYADKFIIYPITAGVNYWPNPISLLPGGSNPCDTTTVDFQLYGSAITPGATVKFAVRLADSQHPDDWCCFESDTVCVTIPTCPTGECCESEETFDSLVAQGFQITQNGCNIEVCANQFDSCHWFYNQSPDWGDGSIILPTVMQSDPPNNCWTYTYAIPGNYTITLPLWEGSLEDTCWTGELVYEFMCDGGCPQDTIFDCCLNFDTTIVVDPFNLSGGLPGNGHQEDFVDVDNDGDFDYVYGFSFNSTTHEVRYLENIGTSNNPSYSSTPISLFSDQLNPYGYDYNNDGFEDLFTIDASTYELIYHENQGSPSASFVSSPLGINLPFTFSIALEDLSGDGNVDLLYDNSATGGPGGGPLEILYYEGQTNSPALPSFNLVGNTIASPFINTIGTNVRGFHQIELFDGDCDGDIDIFYTNGSFGSGDEVWFLENYGGPTSPGNTPNLETTTPAINPYGLIGWITNFEESNIRFVDIDADGKAEAFINGGIGGDMSFFENCTSGGDTIIISDCCCESEETFDSLVAQGFQITQNGCNIEVCANQFDTCHWFYNQGPDWGDGTPILPSVLQSDPPNNCWIYTYATPGNYTITLPLWEGTLEDTCWTGELVHQFMCDEETNPCDSLMVTNSPAMTADSICCSTFTVTHQDNANDYKGVIVNATSAGTISQVQGLSGYIVSQISPTSVHITHPSGIMPQGTFDIFTLCTTGYTGAHTVIVSWLQIVNGECIEVCPSEHTMDCPDDDEMKCFDFVQDSVHCESMTYCFQIENTSKPAFAMQSVILYGINGGALNPTMVNIPNGPLAPGVTSDWMCVTYSGASPGDNICYSLAIEDANAGGQSNICCTDTLVQCFEVPDCPTTGGDDCCDITEEEFADKFDIGINYNLTGCELCLPFALDSCEYIDINYGDGTDISLQGPTNVPCYTYGATGSYTVSIDYYRLNTNGDTCRQEQTILDIATSCPPVNGPCLSVIEGELDCEETEYCFRITNTSTFTMKSLAFIELTAGVALSPDPYQLLTPLAPGATSEEICLNYIGAFQGDTVCFDVVGHKEDLTIGEPPSICCKDTIPVCFVIDCPVTPSSCLSVVQDSVDCESNTYCIKVINNAVFTMNSIAFHNFSIGHSLNPDPVGIPALLPGTTSDWICLTFAGAAQGDEICYNIIGHEQDLSMGQEPIFCCSDTTQYCFQVDCDIDDCCTIGDEDLDNFFFTGISYDIVQCELIFPFEEDSCAVITIDYGDGEESESTGGGVILHNYSTNGTYVASILLQYFDSEGEVCQERDTILEIVIDNCPSIVDECTTAELEVYNALSPNNDGLNDRLILEGSITCRKNIKIYNRWGQLVYEKVDYQNDWSGNSFTGEQLAEGTYFLVIEIPDADDNIVDKTQTYIDIRK